MTRMLEVRLFWDDVLFAAESFALTPQLRVEASSEPGAAFLLPDALCPAPIVIADARHVHERVELGALTFVTELHDGERSPRIAWDASAAPAMLLALAFHSSMLVFGGSSPRTGLLALEGPPSLFARAALEAPRRARRGSGASGASTPATPATRTSAAAPATRSPRRRSTARATRDAGEVLLTGFARALSFSTPPAYGANGSGGGAGTPGSGGTNLAWLGEDGVRAGRPGIPCGVGVPCGTAASQGRLFGLGSGYGSGSSAFHGRDENTPEEIVGTCGHGGRCGPHIPLCVCGETAVTGSLSREAIRRVVRRHRNELTYCYERELTARPELEGGVETRFVITASGDVLNVHATSDALPETAACVARVVERMHFPESDGVTGVSYPFTFEAAP